MRPEKSTDIVDAATRSWVSSVLGESVVSAERLAGGMSTELVCLVVHSGQRVVLRRFSGRRWQTAGLGAAANEAKVLPILEPTQVPAPRLLGVDATGEQSDAPSILVESMTGRPMLRPDMRQSDGLGGGPPSRAFRRDSAGRLLR